MGTNNGLLLKDPSNFLYLSVLGWLIKKVDHFLHVNWFKKYSILSKVEWI
jgi:hypothetical protein